MVEVEPPSACSSSSECRKTFTDLLDEMDIDEEWAMVDGSAKAVLEVLVQFGFQETVYDEKKGRYVKYDLRKTQEHWRKCAEEIGIFKFLKWKFSAFYAHWMSVIYPDEPQEVQPSGLVVNKDKVDVLLGGRAYRFVRKLVREEPDRFYEFCQSCLFVKKGCPRPGIRMVLDGVRDAIKTLTTEVVEPTHFCPRESWADIQDEHDNRVTASGEVLDSRVSWDVRDQLFMITKEQFSLEMERTVKEVFLEQYTSDDRIEPFFPSTSANYNRSRAGGGAIGHIIEHFADDLLRLKNKYGPDLVHFQKVKTGRTERVGRDDNLKHKFDGNLFVMDDSKLRSAFRDLYRVILEHAKTEVPIVEPVGLKESLKVRVISKGPPSIYTVLKPLQKYMWRQVRNSKPGRLVGQPIDKWYVQDVLGAKLKTDEKYLSVDYKDATNKMYKWVSSSLVEIIAKHLHLADDEIMIFRRGLVDHMICSEAWLADDHSKVEVGGKLLPQTRGQLMGSVVSFPLLCIVNMTILRLTREYDVNRRLKLKDAGIMVNGDDGCLRCTRRGYHFWRGLSSFVGLEPSIGKVYYSSHFLNMNSRTYSRVNDLPFEDFHIPGEHELVTVKRQPAFQIVPFVNLGLFYGITRSVGDDTNASSPLESVASRARELVQGSPEVIRETVLANYIRYHREELDKLKVPWYLPEHLGGLGLPIIPGTRHVPTDLDLRLARLVHVYSIYPNEENKVFHLPRRPAQKEWQMWSLVAQKLDLLKIDTSPAALHTQMDMITTSRFYFNTRVSLQTIGARMVVAELFNCKSLRYLKREVFAKDGCGRNSRKVRPPTKTDLLERYYGKLRVTNYNIISNTIHPVANTLPYNIANLPDARPSFSDLEIFPVVNFRAETLKEYLSSSSLDHLVEASYADYLAHTEAAYDSDEPWSKAAVFEFHKSHTQWE